MAASSTVVHLRNNEDPALVYLNVYDVNPAVAGVNNPFFRWLGLGSTLSCVQVQGHEFMFWGPGGVMYTCLMNPRTHSTLIGRHSILIGRTQFDEAGVRETVEQLSRNGEYTAASYNLFTNNCHHFSDSLCRRLTGGRGIPWWVNPINATFGLFCRCLLPGDDGHVLNSADRQGRNIADHGNGDADNDDTGNDHDDNVDGDEEHHDDGDHDTDDDDDSEPPYWEILQREMGARSRPTATQQQERSGCVPSNGSSKSSEVLFEGLFSSGGGSAHEQTRIQRSFSIYNLSSIRF